ncbi:hypothetical protein ACFQY4_07315 [Catellatospora bangladeshensis]|uniref:Transmembrane protein n=1 Tax=Catellatospora bangladeshensis TaxID=310355 RepID=A0A8J3JIB7_9ACTN|nr:hypothetical protein [Catellatospora bangladeshensis]GIF78679.1 hypothetical protein Cba03nite_00280 [Catellatospora bangladeshensis]
MAFQDRMTLRNLYLYLVCLITLVISIFAAVSLVRSAVELFYPDPGYYGYPPRCADVQGGKPCDAAQQAAFEVDQKRQQELMRDSQRRNAILGLVTSGTTLAIAVPVYAYHWKRIQTELPPRTVVPAGEPPTV